MLGAVVRKLLPPLPDHSWPTITTTSLSTKSKSMIRTMTLSPPGFASGSALLRRREADEIPVVLGRSDGAGEFDEGRRESMSLVSIHAESVVAAADILHERMPRSDHLC